MTDSTTRRLLASFVALPMVVAPAATAQLLVDVSFAPAMQSAEQDDIIEVDMVRQADGGLPIGFSATTAVLAWDPAVLEFLEADQANASYTWFLWGFLNEPDGINDDLTDGDAVFDAMAWAGDEAFAPPAPDVLVVTTLRFRVLATQANTVVQYLPVLGQFGETHVTALGGVNITGSISHATIAIGDPPPTCPEDLTGDGIIDTLDFLELLEAWGTDPVGPPDFGGNGVVDTEDFLHLLASWGPCAT